MNKLKFVGRSRQARYARAGLVPLILLLLAGCSPSSSDYDDLKAFVGNAGMNMRGKIEPPPEFSSPARVQFSGTGTSAQPFDPARLEHPAHPDMKGR